MPLVDLTEGEIEYLTQWGRDEEDKEGLTNPEMNLYRKLQACLKGEADPTKEMIMAIYVDLKCFVENHFSESKISEEDMVKLKGYLGE